MILPMYTVYYGKDTVAVRDAALKKIEEVRATGAVVTVLDADSYMPGMVRDAVGATSLFGEAQCYVLDTPSADAVYEEEVSDMGEALKESVHTFVVIEGELNAEQKKPYKKYAAEFVEYKAPAAERFNTFVLADSLSRKDKRALWLQLQDATVSGQSAEEIIGVLWWQLKVLRLAAVTKSAEEAGMKAFPYQKAKRALTAFKPGELETLSESLLTVYHDGHAGVRNIDAALEKWVLTL